MSPLRVEEQQLRSELLSDIGAPLQASAPLTTGVASAFSDSELGVRLAAPDLCPLTVAVGSRTRIRI